MKVIFREEGIVKKTLHHDAVPNIGETIIIRNDPAPEHEPLRYKVIGRIMDIGHASCGMWVPDDIIWHIDIKKYEEISNID